MSKIIHLNVADDKQLKKLSSEVCSVIEYLEKEGKIIIGDGQGNVKQIVITDVNT